MTPEKALAILEGKIPRREPAQRAMDEKRMASPKQPLKQMVWPKFQDMSLTMKLLAGFILAAVLAMLYLWQSSVVSQGAYKKGFAEGSAAMNANLNLEQKQGNDLIQQVHQLQQDLGRSNDSVLGLQQEVGQTRHELEAVTQQRDNVSRDLKDLQDSIPGRIAAVQDPLERKIERLTEVYQQRVGGLKSQLHASQRTSHMQKTELAKLQRTILRDQKILDEAHEAMAHKDELIAAATQPLQQQIDKLQQQLKLAQTQMPHKDGMCQSSSQ